MFQLERSIVIEPSHECLSKPTLEFVQTFPDIDVGSIKNFVGEGFYHVVFGYGEDYVVKIPKSYVGIYPFTANECQQQLQLLHHYFPDAIVETHIVQSTKHPYYCFVQKKISSYRFANIEDIKKPEFQKILIANRQAIEKDHATLDFFGYSGFVKCMKSVVDKNETPCMTNILIETDKDGKEHFRIADTTMYMQDTTYDSHALFKKVTARVALRWNTYLMKRFFNIDLLPNKN
jgi:hypothetical protein